MTPTNLIKRVYRHTIKCVGYAFYHPRYDGGSIFLVKNKFVDIKNESWDLELHGKSGLNHSKVSMGLLTKDLIALRDILDKAIAKHCKTNP